jgi:hypothetical protein
MKRLLLLAFTFLLGVVVLNAQEDRGRISGLVTDQTGAIVPRASITVTNEGTGVSQSSVSDASGTYIFEYLNPGVYTVSASSPGFKQFIVNHIRIEVAQHAGIDVKFEVGQATESITVQESGGAAIRTVDSVLGYTIEGRSVTDLPNLYGNPFEYQLLAPGVTSTTLANGNHTYEGGSESAKIDGSQTAQTEFTLDGAPDSRNASGVTAAYVPNKEFVGEFRMLSSPYDASLAHTSGGSLDASIRSGTAQFHGGASMYYQDAGVDAPAFSLGTHTAPSAAYHRETGEVGGPILRKRLFFFTGYEHQFNRQAASTTTTTVPTDAEKKGDFSALLPLGKTVTNTPVCTVSGVTYYAPAYNNYQIFNPYQITQDPRCPGISYQRAPYTNNVLPSIDPVAAKILAYFPEPTGSAVQGTNGSNNFVSNVTNVDFAWSETTRIDYNLSENQKLFGHYIISNRSQPGKNAYFPGASGQTLTLKNKAVSLDYVNTLNPQTILDVRYSFTRPTTLTSLDAKTTATELGVNPNALAGSSPLAAGFPQVKVTGYATLGNSDPGYENDNIHDAQINLSRSLNRHQLKVGIGWREYQANQADLTGEHLSISATGNYMKGPDYSGSIASSLGQGLAGLEAGIAESTQMTLNAKTSNNTDYLTAYFQDDWKVLPSLTLNLGLRYEYFSPLRERHNKSIMGFAFNTANPVASAATAAYAKAYPGTSSAYPYYLSPSAFTVNGGLVYAPTGGGQQDLWKTQSLNFSPRFGFAFAPTPKIVVRGGFGIFYGHLGEAVMYPNSTGFTQTTNTVPTNDSGQTFIASLANPFPNGLTQPSGSSNGLLQGTGTSITFFPQSPKSPYSERFSLGFQYSLPSSIVVEADYVGSLGKHIRISRDYDPVPNSLLNSTSIYRDAADNATNLRLGYGNANPFKGITMPGGPSMSTASTLSNSQLAKPFPEFTGITSTEPIGFSTYNALQASLQKRFANGYSATVAYTRSRALDAITFLNPGDVHPWYGVSNGDYPEVLSISGIYELPFGPGKPFLNATNQFVAQEIRGFQIEGTYRVQSGQPIAFNNAGSILAPGKTFKDIQGPSKHTVQQWFNTDAFISAVGTTVYNPADTVPQNELLQSNLRTFPLRFNNVRQDFQNIANLGAMKKFVVRERFNMAVRAEAINAFNHPVFSAPTSDPSSTSFGQITGFGNGSRMLQFAFETTF